MTDDRKIWIGRDGERFGPYDEATLRAWVDDGKVSATSLAWHEGMDEWRPLHEVLGIAAPPPMAGEVAATSEEAMRASLPEPLFMHWGLLILLWILTLGILGLVWPFMQASWVKKIDPQSRAGTWLTVSVTMIPVSWLVSIMSVMAHTDGLATGNSQPFALIQFAIAIAQIGFLLAGFFSMARSMRERLPAYGVVPDIGGATLFFFNVFYLQGQMNWLTRWRKTGQVDPPPPKAVFWVLWCIPLVAIVAITLSLNH